MPRSRPPGLIVVVTNKTCGMLLREVMIRPNPLRLVGDTDFPANLGIWSDLQSTYPNKARVLNGLLSVLSSCTTNVHLCDVMHQKFHGMLSPQALLLRTISYSVV